MVSPLERKKNNFGRSLLPSFSAELKKYEDIYQLYTSDGYIKQLCDLYAETFISEVKKPSPEDIIQVAVLYDKIHDLKSAAYYLDMLEGKHLSGDVKFHYCIEKLNVLSKLGKWRDAEEFRTDNINFLQNFSQKKSLLEKADMYMALALADCSAKHYNDAFKMMKFGYKPQGKNDTKLLEIMITYVYISAKSGDADSIDETVANANACLKLFSEFEFSWSRSYYVRCINDAAEGII